MRFINKYSAFFFLGLLLALVTESYASPATDEYAARRANLSKQIGPDSLLILLSPNPAQRNGDVDWPYRQEDSILYLTGLTQPETNLILSPGDDKRKEVVYTQDSNPQAETWTGRLLTASEVSDKSGVKDIASSSQFESQLYDMLNSANSRQKMREGKLVVWMILETRGPDNKLSRELSFVEQLRRHYPELQFRDAFPILAEMRLIKSNSELSTIQKTIDITVAAQAKAMREIYKAKFEYEIQATIEYTFRNMGACCWAFPSIVASGKNATTLHYGTNNDAIQQGSLMLTDIGAEVDGYGADVTRTYPQSGTFNPEQKAIYSAVLRAQTETIPLMRDGNTMKNIQVKATSILGEELLKLGLITKNIPEQVRLYFLHGLGHQLGLRTHDVGYSQSNPIKNGMVITNEPGLYVRPMDVKASKTYLALSSNERAKIDIALAKYADIGVRIEDDILITKGEPRNLSSASPRTIEDIENFMRIKTN